MNKIKVKKAYNLFHSITIEYDILVLLKSRIPIMNK